MSIKEIAEAAGFSPTTVSHALNGKGRVPAETREHVRAVADRLGYAPSRRGRALRSGRSYIVAMQIGGVEGGLVPDFSFFLEQINAASAAALDAGYGVVVVPTAGSRSLIQHLEPDGALVVDPTGREEVFGLGVPVVAISRPPEGTKVAGWVDNDMVAATRGMLDHLHEQGCGRPALLATQPGQTYVDDTVAAYEAWCAEHLIRPTVQRLAGLPTEGAAMPAVIKLLKLKRRPDAIITTLDRAAVGVIAAARKLGLSVPHDVAVTAVTDSTLLRSVEPPVTALEVGATRMAREAVAILLEAIEDPAAPVRTARVATKLIPRASTKRPEAAKTDARPRQRLRTDAA